MSLAKNVTSFFVDSIAFIETGQLRSIRLPPTSALYSSLTKLVVNVNSFDECLTLLDGRFESLSDFAINIDCIDGYSDGLDQMVSELRYVRSMTQSAVSLLEAPAETEAFPLDFTYSDLFLQECRHSTAPSTVSRRRAESASRFHAKEHGTFDRWASPLQQSRRPSSSTEAIPIQTLHSPG